MVDARAVLNISASSPNDSPRANVRTTSSPRTDRSMLYSPESTTNMVAPISPSLTIVSPALQTRGASVEYTCDLWSSGKLEKRGLASRMARIAPSICDSPGALSPHALAPR
eukprot:494375-Prymnesium_polylepis.1